MKRRLLQVLIAMSAVLCVGSLYAWGRSYWPEDFGLRSYRGRLVVLMTSGNYSSYNEKGTTSYRSTARLWQDFHRMAQSQWQGLGFSYAAADIPYGAYRLVAIPYPLVILATAVAPAWWAWHARILRRRKRQGCCAGCGYDLRGSGDRCPECGMTAAAPAAAP